MQCSAGLLGIAVVKTVPAITVAHFCCLWLGSWIPALEAAGRCGANGSKDLVKRLEEAHETLEFLLFLFLL